MKYLWAYERSIHSVRLMADFAAELGVSHHQILKGTGLEQQQLLDPNTLVTGQQELQLIRNLVERFGKRPLLGLEIGTRYHFTAFGSLGLGLISSANIREALNFALAYFPLSFAFSQFVVSEPPETRTIKIEIVVDDGIPPALWQFIIQRDLAALITVQQDLIRENLCEKVAFTFQPHGEIQSYRVLFGITPEFGGSKNFVVLDAEKIDQKLSMANELVLHSAEQQCREILDKRQSQKKYTDQVQQILMNSRRNIPSMEEVADGLCLNSRTLRRYLAQEQTTFIKIREEVRKILADSYLSSTQTSIEQISEWLGYAEPASFIHAYKRWYGKTPHATRLKNKV
ncbi:MULTISPECIES: AraC family transcriptional regulator [unclassified Acinetobacter]|uniref:AraC family transcriptional regulator n=1 Tax=unclassified Acinetobacter TaxID=196816 RepID=UPI001F4B8748|nr:MULTISPECIES: AraC family transcriptional regulator [unclassified Acinetobacter]MCH7352317.1 AraC family transcriptional regulator [Acinetobacter sp. NIPH 2023]MCH7358284.1 AraC family transcriptional regulator [Acinetobacter sp. NIPH 2024]